MEEESIIHCGLGIEVGIIMVVLYADDSLVGSRDLVGLQAALNVLIGIFCRVILMAHIAKSKTMKCQTGAICTGMSEEAVSRRSTGVGANYGDLLRRCILILCPFGALKFQIYLGITLKILRNK